MGKKLLLVLAMLLTAASICYAGWVDGYTRSDGTSVSGYYRSDPNGTVQDNYSYKGNVNPSTGEVGTNYYRHSPSSQYYQGN